MTERMLRGLNGSNPLGFLSAVGFLRILSRHDVGARLGFTRDGAFTPWVSCGLELDLAHIVADDAAREAGPRPWRLRYAKQDKGGAKEVFDLKAPPSVFTQFLDDAIGRWLAGYGEHAEYAAAFGADGAVDGNGNTKPTAFHFTSAQQQFLDTVEKIRAGVTVDWAARALFEPGATELGQNLRWDPDAERSRALMGVNPSAEKTIVNAPLEWLAFRSLPLFPCVPVCSGGSVRVATAGVTGRRQADFAFQWPLWDCGASIATVGSLLTSIAGIVGGGTMGAVQDLRARGVFALCRSDIRRTAQGFGNFGPASISG